MKIGDGACYAPLDIPSQVFTAQAFDPTRPFRDLIKVKGTARAKARAYSVRQKPTIRQKPTAS
jgi:hypothetical protein